MEVTAPVAQGRAVRLMGLAVRDAETVWCLLEPGRLYPLLLESGKKPAGGAAGRRQPRDGRLDRPRHP